MKFFRILPAIYAIYLGVVFFDHDIREGLMQYLRSIIVLLGIVAFVAWREWRIATDSKFAARQAEEYHSVFSQVNRAFGVSFWIFVALFVGLVALANRYPPILGAHPGEALMFAGFFVILGPIAIGVLRYLSLR